MNSLNYAMKIEKEGAKLYRKLAENSPNNELSILFNWLADAELNHLKTFKIMKPILNENIDSELFEDSDNILKNLKKINVSNSLEISSDIYSEILKMETELSEFYYRQSENSQNTDVKNIILKIAEEEKRHQEVILKLISFVNNSEIWLKECKFREILSYISL